MPSQAKTPRLTGKTAVVTGAASGIGKAVSERLSAEGAAVVMTDLDEPGVIAAAHDVQGETLALPHDVSCKAQWSRVVDATLAAYGRLDALVNSAGILMAGTIEDTRLEDWHRIMRVNVDGTFFGCQAAIPAMRAGSGGSIVNLSSISALRGDENLLAYDASKGAVRALTKEVALHCAAHGYGIRCNSVHPGVIDTPMVQDFFSAAADPVAVRSQWVATQPNGRMGRPAEIASMICFLVSDDASFVTGAEYVIDGGSTA